MVWPRRDSRSRSRFLALHTAVLVVVTAFATGTAVAEEPNPKRFEYGPHYRPSSNSKAAIDISTNAYGAYKWAPKAPKIGDRLENIKIATTQGDYDFSEAYKKGPVVLIFYRGFW